MALLHLAVLSPTKADAIASWLPSRSWAPPAAAGDVQLVGAFRFDDPEGEVGIETHLVRAGGVLLQVPLTYRGSPLAGAEAGLVTEMDHSVLGRRWVYDACVDPVYWRTLAAAALTGVGQAAQLALVDGRWVVQRPNVVVRGGGWLGEQLVIDGFGAPVEQDGWARASSPELQLRVARRPEVATAPVGLRATWAGQDDPMLLAIAEPTAQAHT